MGSRTARLLICAAVLIPRIAFADGGGPLLLIINGFVFSVGQIWILLSEFGYLCWRLPSIKRSRLAGWTLGINVISTSAGAILIPLTWAAVFGLLSFVGPWRDTSLGDALLAAGTWVADGNAQYAWLAMTVSALLVVVTYFVTVWIQYRFLLAWGRREIQIPSREVLKLSYVMNGLSYAGLVVLLGAGYACTWMSA